MEGDCLWVSPASPDRFRKGDVVAFDSGGKVIAHRIVGRRAGDLITQGDANQGRDRHCLMPGHVIGRVVARERSGMRSPVRGGMRGCLQGGLLRGLNRALRRIVAFLDGPYKPQSDTDL